MSDGNWLDRVRRAPSPLIVRQLARSSTPLETFDARQLSRLAALEPANLDFERFDDPVSELRLADADSPVRLGKCERQGRTIVLSFTAVDLGRIAELGARSLRAAGIEPGMRVGNTLEGGLETPGSLLFGDALERLGALDVPLGGVPDGKTAETIRAMIERVEIDVLVLDARVAGTLAPELRRKPPRSWRGTVWLGMDPPELRGWRRRWVSVPEVSAFLALDCRQGRLHVDPDVRVEIRERRIRLSSLAGDAPIFAYEPGLEARGLDERCGCGDSRPVLVL